MAKFLVEVECPEGYEPAYGKESFRPPKRGENYVLDGVGKVYTATFGFDTDRHLVVRPVWKWPKWLKARWIAMSRSGEWFAYQNEPRLSLENWITDKGQVCRLTGGLFDFTPPPCDGYRSSLRHNPYLEMDE